MSESSPNTHPSRERLMPLVICGVIGLIVVAAAVAFVTLRSADTSDTEVTTPANPAVTVTQSPGGSADADNDGLTAAQEQQYKTDPALTDSDDDGFTDGEEVRGGFNPAGPGRL